MTLATSDRFKKESERLATAHSIFTTGGQAFDHETHFDIIELEESMARLILNEALAAPAIAGQPAEGYFEEKDSLQDRLVEKYRLFFDQDKAEIYAKSFVFKLAHDAVTFVDQHKNIASQLQREKTVSENRR